MWNDNNFGISIDFRIKNLKSIYNVQINFMNTEKTKCLAPNGLKIYKTSRYFCSIKRSINVPFFHNYFVPVKSQMSGSKAYRSATLD